MRGNAFSKNGSVFAAASARLGTRIDHAQPENPTKRYDNLRRAWNAPDVAQLLHHAVRADKIQVHSHVYNTPHRLVTTHFFRIFEAHFIVRNRFTQVPVGLLQQTAQTSKILRKVLADITRVRVGGGGARSRLFGFPRTPTEMRMHVRDCSALTANDPVSKELIWTGVLRSAHDLQASRSARALFGAVIAPVLERADIESIARLFMTDIRDWREGRGGMTRRRLRSFACRAEAMSCRGVGIEPPFCRSRAVHHAPRPFMRSGP